MKVEIERKTGNAERHVFLSANDITNNPAVIRQWIKMLQLAERWLREGKPK